MKLVAPRSWASGLEGEKAQRCSDLVADGREQPTTDPVSLVALLGCQIE